MPSSKAVNRTSPEKWVRLSDVATLTPPSHPAASKGVHFPKHDASLHLTHNQHKAYYLSVAQSIEQDDFGYAEDCWVSAEQKQKAIETNDCWTLQWYPNTPVGFEVLSAADLDVLLEAAAQPAAPKGEV